MDNHTAPILNNLEAQLNHRLEKLWRVFDWTSKLMIGLTAGILVAIRGINQFVLYPQDRFLITAVIFITAFYACSMIRENLKFERKLRDEMVRIFEQQLNYHQLNTLRPDRARFGYEQIIIILGSIALIATWLDLVIPLPPSPSK